MAENVLPVRMQLRYDTYSNWMNSETILLPGEIAIAAMHNRNTLLSSNNMPENTPPAVGIKVGDGTSYFYELPWLQAVSADVYNWAKTATKPTYNANEITGLAEYISQHGGGGGSGGTGGASGYQIVYDSVNKKYVLQYYDEETGEWVNTTSEIEFAEILNRITALENWANGDQVNIGNLDFPLIAFVYDQVLNYLNRLDVSDMAVAHQFVTQVEQIDGKIYVTRSGISVNDLTGTITTEHGGTGLSRVEMGEILVGSMEGTITTKNIATIIDTSERDQIPTTGALINYVDNATAGLTGAMHFVGESSVTITTDSPSRVDPQIPDYNFRQAQPGDVILANNTQEFVWTGAFWRLLGDEGSYAIKGSITNVDISDEAAIAVSKIDGLDMLLSTKVDKVEGKGLSSNDYTDEDKQKLTDIEDGAQANIIEHVFLNDEEVYPSTVEGLPKSINLQFNGMSVEQGQKLDGIEAGAQVNTIESIKLNGTTIPPDANKAVNIDLTELMNKVDGIEEGAQVNTVTSITLDGTTYTPNEEKSIVINSDPHTEHINKIEHIFVNGTEVDPQTFQGEEKSVNIVIDPAALDLNVLEGAVVPNGATTEEVTVTNKKLELARIAKTGDVRDLLQTQDTYIILNCGSSTEVI